MVLVFLVPVPALPISVPNQFDKLVHFGLFLGFALLYDLDRRPSMGRTLLVSFAFAGGIELVQWVLPYRSADWWDFLAGATGAGVGAALAILVTAR
jgi:VanZ family protein